MKRREFITLSAGAAVAWPLAARAQQRDRIRRIGVLRPATETDPGAQARVAAFRLALQKLGWTEGRTVSIDIRWASGDPAAAHKYATELVALRARSYPRRWRLRCREPLLQATRTVPDRVHLRADPVGCRLRR